MPQRSYLFSTKVRPNAGDNAFAFSATTSDAFHAPYLCIVRPNGDVFVERVGLNMIHFSLHRPRLGQMLADCHIAITNEDVKSRRAKLDHDVNRLPYKWQRKIGQGSIELALKLIFPAQFALKTASSPQSEEIHSIKVNKFQLDINETLEVEFLFGEANETMWKNFLLPYAAQQKFFSLPSGKLLCLNFYKTKRNYSYYRRGTDYRELCIEEIGCESEELKQAIIIGWHGPNAMGLLHGKPRLIHT